MDFIGTDDGGVFINPDRLDFKRYATRPPIAKALIDYLLYHDHNPKKALELAAEATVAVRANTKQFDSSLRNQPMVVTYLELAKVYLKLDQPNTALEHYAKAKYVADLDVGALRCGREKFPEDVHILIGIARSCWLHSAQVLALDPANIEAIACLASNHFYTDHPEVALRYYRRLLQMDVNTTELWCNVGLCCFYASQYDLTLSCFERALALASDDNMADVWYNIGQVAVGIGDLGLAYQAFKIAVSVDSNHAESYNNLGARVLELRKGNVDQARAHFQFADGLATFMFEPTYNRALLAYKIGDFQDAYAKVSKALQVYPEHADSLELKRQLEAFLTMI
ncbi:hypothetical protein DYB32_007147 [Aphanomyces invadans]|uniref:Uncharacterized protein n=1 Tax=Aphanomyces invadans TaxID=157072 RepID=A0A3R6VTW4_9STRA|nr:hypothetical protein DYB32_007147 [Aphanomyces invadans]